MYILLEPCAHTSKASITVLILLYIVFLLHISVIQHHHILVNVKH